MFLKGRFRAILWLLSFLPRVPYYMLIDRIDRSLFTRLFFGIYRGIAPWELERWITDGGIAYWQRHIRAEGMQRIEQHRQEGDRIVLATGGVEHSLVPLIGILAPERVICARLEVQSNRFTGCLTTGAVVGEAKAEAVRRLATELGLDLSQCYAYGDSYSDREFLECVGHPAAVNPDRALRRLAETRGWPVLHWRRNTSAPLTR